MSLAKKKIEKIADELDFTTDFRKEQNRKFVNFETFSPCGQNFFIEIEYKNLNELSDKLYDYWQDYDPSEETSLWIDSTGHGKNGAPYKIGDIYEDMKWCESQIEALQKAVYRGL